MTPFLALVDDDPGARARSRRRDRALVPAGISSPALQRDVRAGPSCALRGFCRGSAHPDRERHGRTSNVRCCSGSDRSGCARSTSRMCARRDRRRRAALDDVHRLEREGVRWARALALLVRASIEQADRAREVATLRTAIAELEACDLGLYADAARRRLAVAEAGSDAARVYERRTLRCWHAASETRRA